MNRLQLLVGLYSVALVGLVPMMAIMLLSSRRASDGHCCLASGATMSALDLVWWLPAPFQASMIWRRAHDLGLPGYIGLAPIAFGLGAAAIATPLGISLENTWQGIIVAFPVVIGVFAVVLAPSQQGANRFGLQQTGFKLKAGGARP